MSTELALRPMSTSQVLDRTFSLYKRNFLLFAGITALPPALLMIGQLVLQFAPRAFLGKGAGSDPSTATAAIALAGLAYLVLLVLALVGYALASGASVYAVSRLHLGHVTTIGESYRLIRPYFGNILGIVVLVALCVFGVAIVGLACVVVPIALMVGGGRLATQNFSAGLGVAVFFGGLVCLAAMVGALFLSAKFALTVPACVLERLGVIDSMKRSWHLTEGSVLRLILIIILTAVMAWLLGIVLSIPYFAGIAIVVSRKDPSALLPFVVWQNVAEFLSRTLAGPVSTIAGALIYYDQRVRKEAFDLQLMMEAIGQPSQPAAGAAAPGIG